MKLLKLAIETQNWDLAAHTLVYGAARVLNNGVKPDAKAKASPGRPAGQPKRS